MAGLTQYQFQKGLQLVLDTCVLRSVAVSRQGCTSILRLRYPYLVYMYANGQLDFKEEAINLEF